MKAITGTNSTAREQAWPQTISVPLIKQQRLRAYLRGEVEAGRIGRHYEIIIDRENGQAVAHVLRKRMPFPMKYRVMLGAAGALSALGAVTWLAWESRYIIGAGLLAALGIAIMAASSDHKIGCPGVLVHCPGCKG